MRYPDYGPATVVAAALAAGAPWELGLGLSVGAGAGARGARRAGACRWCGGWNARAIQRRAAALAAGESRAIRRLQYGGLLRDAVRGALLTASGSGRRLGARRAGRRSTGETAVGLTLVAIGAALSPRRPAGRCGARAEGPGSGGSWPALVAGTLLAVLR